jgi:hypothetical protein
MKANPMRFASLTLPILDNNGNDLSDVHTCLQADIIDTFGGFTRTLANGGWRDDATGKIYCESVAVYAIAMNEDSLANDGKLTQLAKWHGAIAGQIAMCVQYASGDVKFITCKAFELAEA